MGEVRGRPAACPGPFNPPERHRTMSSSERDYLSGRRRHCINPQEKEGRRLESAREESGGRMASTFIPSGINLYMYRAGVLGRLSRCVIFIQWRERESARAGVWSLPPRDHNRAPFVVPRLLLVHAAFDGRDLMTAGSTRSTASCILPLVYLRSTVLHQIRN